MEMIRFKSYNKDLTDDEVSQVLAHYLENRIDLSHWRKFQVRKTLDCNTWEKVFTYLSSKLKLDLDITVAGNPAFDAARGTKNRMKRDAQALGYGTLDHQRDPVPVDVLEVLLKGWTINICQPFPLVAGFYVLFTITFMCRVGQEMFNLRRKDIHLHFN